jgi:hypothetical protein
MAQLQQVLVSRSWDTILDWSDSIDLLLFSEWMSE